MGKTRRNDVILPAEFTPYILAIRSKETSKIIIDFHHCMIQDSWLNRKLIALYHQNQLADYENDH